MSKVKSESWFWAQPFFILQRATFTPDLYTKNLCTRSLLHQRPCKPKSSRRLPQQNASRPETFFTKGPLRRCQTALHQKKFTPDSEYVCTENLLHKKTFNTRTLYTSLLYTKDFYTRRLLHQNPFTPQGPCIYTSTVYTKNSLRRGNLNQTTVTRKNFYTKQLFTELSFPSETVCTRSLLTPEAFTPGTCTPCNYHTRRRFQQKFSHQRIFTAKPFKSKNGFYSRIC